ncbi:MAG: FliM/FliN family flagellar motor switch protein [SAR324 cluster bacterium]
MAEVYDDFEIKLSKEDSPDDILNDQGDIELFEEDRSGDEPLAGMDEADLDDILSASDDMDDAPDEDEIDLGMDEIGELVEDLKLDLADDDSSLEGEVDMVFDEEETEDDSNDSVESLLDELGDDDSEELNLADDSAEEESSADIVDTIETDIEGSSETDNEQISTETESTEEAENSSGDDSGSSESSNVLDMLHDPEISAESTEQDPEDMELGMDTLDDTKDDDLTDLGLDDTETVQSDEEDAADITEEVVVQDETTEDEITDLGIEDVETPELDPETIESATEPAEIEPEAEDISALKITTDTQGEFEKISEDKEEIEIQVQVQETPAIDIVESEMPIKSEAAETIAAPLGSDMLLNFNHEVVVEIARTRLTGEEITQITYGSIIELDKVAGEPVNLVLDGKTIALGEVVQINNEKLGIRIIGVIQD